MKLACDPRHNVACIRLRAQPGQVETIRVSDALKVDLAPDGRIHDIELLNVNEQLRAGDGGRIVVADEAKGEARARAGVRAPPVTNPGALVNKAWNCAHLLQRRRRRLRRRRRADRDPPTGQPVAALEEPNAGHAAELAPARVERGELRVLEDAPGS